MIKLTMWEQFAISMGTSFLSMLGYSVAAGNPVVLSMWEQFAVGMALSFLSVLGQQTTNATELSALQSTVAFLQALTSGQRVEAAGLTSAIAFLQKLLAGQVPSV